MKICTRLVCLVLVLGLAALPVPSLAQFNTTGCAVCPCDDTTSSIGMVIVWVDIDHRGLLNTQPGWNSPTANHWTSGVLQDFATTIGKSCEHNDGDATDSGGALVGTLGTTVSDSSFALVPGGGDFTEGPVGSNEIHTEITSMSLVSAGTCPVAITVRAGVTQAVTPSFGEVESTTGNPAVDFPAESFFNIFVEIDTPFYGGSILENTVPLVITNPSLTTLPPSVVYIHGETTSVPIYFKTGINAGQRFGFLRLAGHAPSMSRCGSPGRPSPCLDDPNCPDDQTLVSAVLAAGMMPCPECADATIPVITPMGIVVMTLLLAGLFVAILRRRRGERVG